MDKVSKRERAVIVDVLAKAFDQNRSVNWVIKNDKKRKNRIRALVGYSPTICSKVSGVLLSPDAKGSVLFDLPHQPKKDKIDLLINELRLAFSVIGLSKVIRVLKRERYIKRYHPKKEFMYLWFIGVFPDGQGQGVGGRLMEQVLAIAERKGLPIYLETSTPENLPFYQKWGFEVYHRWDSQLTGFPIWFLQKV